MRENYLHEQKTDRAGKKSLVKIVIIIVKYKFNIEITNVKSPILISIISTSCKFEKSSDSDIKSVYRQRHYGSQAHKYQYVGQIKMQSVKVEQIKLNLG